MQNIKKTLEMTGLLFGMALLFSFIAWFLGYEGFIIFGHIEYSIWIDYIICPILLCINLSLLTGFVLDLYSWKVLWFSIPMAMLSGILGPFFPVEIFTGPVPTLVLIIAIFWRKVGKWGFIKLAISTGITFIFQAIMSLIMVIPLSGNLYMYSVYRLSISSIILMLLLYSIGGVNNVIRNSVRYDNGDVRRYWKQSAKRLELLVFPGRIRDDKSRNESSSNSSQNTENIPVSKFELWVLRSVIAIIQIIQWIFILWVCNLDNYFVDALAITTSFICHGMIIIKRKHLKPIIICTFAATIMFYFAARFTISFHYSPIFPILVGLILVYTIYRISYQFEKANKERSKKDLERIKNINKKIDQAWDKLDKLF